MLSRLLTRVLGSRHDAHLEARRRDGRLEARLNELRLESLGARHELSAEPFLLIPGPSNGTRTMLPDQDSSHAIVEGNVPEYPTSDSEALSINDVGTAGEPTDATMTSVPIERPAMRAPEPISPPPGSPDPLTISGIIPLEQGDVLDSFVTTGAVAISDGIETTQERVTLASGMATPPFSNEAVGSHSFTARSAGDVGLTMSVTPDLGENRLPTGTISGAQTALNTYDNLDVDVLSSLWDGVLSDSGALSFTAPTITTASLCQTGSSATGGGMVDDAAGSEFTGTAVVNGVTSVSYCFRVSVSLPVAGTANSTGFLTIRVSGPCDYSHSTPTCSV